MTSKPLGSEGSFGSNGVYNPRGLPQEGYPDEAHGPK